MKNRRKTFCFILFCFLSLSLFSQGYIDNSDLVQLEKIHQKEMPVRQFSIKTLTMLDREKAVEEQNSILIKQVGDNNYIKSHVITRESKLNLIQLGNDNFTAIESMVNNIEGTVLQNGDNNFSFTSAHDPSSTFLLDVNMNGNNNHFESYGMNSIGNKLKFQMNGNSKSIIIRNFK